MTVAIEIVILCAVFFGCCYLGTGTDEKNLKSYSTYPAAVQEKIKATPQYSGKYKDSGKTAVFLSNFLLFLVLFFILGVIFRKESFWYNFFVLSIMGQTLNLVDLLFIDLLWWRRTKRIRFTQIPEKELYQDPAPHIGSFCRAIVMYFLVAALDGYLLTLF